EKTVLDTGAVPAKCIRYPDHFFYRARDLTRLARAANRIGACAVVTTEKDGVRIAEWTERLPLYCLRIRIEVDGLEKLLKMCLDIARG
ncbi:MAG TPA: tetraacyldisaccharide 4'-kinase, partial [bacterium]